ncbi:MAG TPA: hypothetical protein VEO54_08465 [Thermoanaerobaculia bacterium]|nr:hypothetical protein [Thermoanaerobaculia bacterium]
MKVRNAVFLWFLLMFTGAASAQYYSYVATPSGVSYGASPSVLSLEIQTGYPRAIVRKNDWTAFQTSGTMRLYQNGVVIATVPQYAGSTSVVLPFSWNFTSGTRSYYAITTTNPYASGSVSVTAGYIPAPPSGVTASATSSSSATISWNAVSGATRYKVRHVASGAQTGDLYSTSYSWTGLAAGTNHCFVVLACAGNGFCSSPSAQACTTTPVAASGKYKVGVLMYGDDADYDLSGAEARLRQMISEIASNRPVRVGNGREVRLVVQLEVPWNRTDTHNFWWYQQFARLCERLSVKWTPLLSPHYVPPAIEQWYAGDRVTDMNGNVLNPPPAFLQFSPSSPVWGTETAQWVEAFIRAMQNDGGVNHFGPNGAIDEILIGNEMQYPADILTSRDPRSIEQWHLKHGSATPYPATLTTAFRTFRAEQLSYAINSMLARARSTFDSLGLSSIGVSSKLYPYNFPRTDEQDEQRRAGYTDSSLAFLDSNFRNVFAIDSYPSAYCPTGTWSLTKDYAAADNRTAKSLYIAEFNVPKIKICENVVLSRSQVSQAVITGFQSYNVRNFTFFAWNPTGTDAHMAINPEQKLGLADAMNWVVP